MFTLVTSDEDRKPHSTVSKNSVRPGFASSAFAQDAGEIEFWQSVSQSNNPTEMRAYLEAYPNGRFVPLARVRLKALQRNSRTFLTCSRC